MSIDSSPADDSASPRAADVLPILVIVGVIAGLSRLIGRPLVGVWIALTFALGSAGLVGGPALFWALDHGRTRLGQLVALGTMAGSVPLLLVLASGVLGRFIRGGLPWVETVLSRGAPIPFAGLISWSRFLWHEAGAILIGATSAAIYSWVYVRRKDARRS